MSDTNGNTGGGVEHGNGGWQPTPQGEFDADATAFVQMPEGFGLADFEEGAAGTPLAAPGGYVPPQISVGGAAATDPAATGAFIVPTMGSAPEAPTMGGTPGTQGMGSAPEPQPGPADGVRWPEPDAPQQSAPQPPTAPAPGATGQWTFTDPAAAQDPGAGYAPQAPAAYPGQDFAGYGEQQPGGYDAQGYAGYGTQDPAGQANVTGQWSIPVAHGELPDESGEFTQSSLIEQWGGDAPATLPGGAPAPWATPEPVAEAGPAAEPAGDVPVEPAAVESAEPVEPAGPVEPATVVEPATGAEPAGPADPATVAPAAAEQPVPDAEPQPVPDANPAPVPTAAAEAAVEAPHGAPESQEAQEAQAAREAQSPGTPEATQEQPPAFSDEHPLTSYVLRVNGTDRPVTDAWIGESLLYVLRERLGLAGAKDGCSQGECGACAVQVDGRLVASCLVPAATTAGSEVRTVEGLAADGQPSDVQRALASGSAVQCGFCIPGMAMTVHDLLEGNPAPTERETRQALCGNLCRCTGYRGVLGAVRDVVAERRAAAEAEGAESAEGAEPAEGADGTPTPLIPHQAAPGTGGAQPQHHPHPDAQDGGPA